jgi:anaerobic dimethyl sulfoxide reductase subunit B (iron-sulfur subunit)
MSASISSKEMGVIVQYDYCDGCHACEMACKQEHSFKPDEYGIKVMYYVIPRQ